MENGTITRRMDSAINGLENEFRTLCDRRDFESKLAALKLAGTNSNRSSKLRELFDLFDLCGIAYERGKDNAYYEKLVEDSEISTFTGVEDRMLYALYTRYQEYPTPEEYMKQIVDRLSSDEDDWTADTLRVRILKQFIKYGNYLSDAGFGGKKYVITYVQEKLGRKPTDNDILDVLDDGVFSELNTATKPQRRTDGKYGLLKTVDDLANGKFRAEGATRKSLYLFAMVYGMTYYSGGLNGAEILDYKTDIETNLFHNYYMNNLMRFISDAYRGNLSEYELDPSGQGINYKNFAEMIYLYYLNKNISRQDKIRLSSEMMERVQSNRFKEGALLPERTNRTAYYKNFWFASNDGAAVFAEDVLSMPEDVFEQWLCEHYDCDTYVGTYETEKGPVDQRVGVFQLETEQASAFREYQAILKALDELGVPRKKCNYGLWFTDVAAFKNEKKRLEDVSDKYKDIDPEQFQAFIDLLLGVNSFMGYTADENDSEQNINQEWTETATVKTKALYVSSPSAVTRTSMIVAYYYYYNALHEKDAPDQWKNFEQLFNNFKKDLDPRLEAAYYQPLSGKNIFDVLVAFSSYAYLNL